jgi:hypothetical protein
VVARPDHDAMTDEQTGWHPRDPAHAQAGDAELVMSA